MAISFASSRRQVCGYSPLYAVGHLGQRSNRRPGIAAILIVFVRDPDQHQLGGRVVQALLERP